MASIVNLLIVTTMVMQSWLTTFDFFRKMTYICGYTLTHLLVSFMQYLFLFVYAMLVFPLDNDYNIINFLIVTTIIIKIVNGINIH